MAETIIIPATVQAAVKELNGIDALLTAKGWQRAAIVAAFVELSESGKSPTSRMGTVEFADLDIAGLSDPHTVRRYVKAWLDTHDQRHPRPGAKVRLPSTKWPPEDSNLGSRLSVDPERAVEQIIEKHGPGAVATAVRRPDVARAVVDDSDAHLEVVKAATTRTPRPRPMPDHPEPAARAMLAIRIERLGADAEAIHRLAMQEFAGTYVWRPGECEGLIQTLEAVIRRCDDVKTVLTTNVSDEDLADILGQ